VRLFHKTVRIENLLSTVSEDERLKVLLLMARQLGIPSFSVHGAQGVYEGSIFDENVHSRYVLDKQWAPELQRLLLNAIFTFSEGTYVDVGANIGLTSIPIALASKVQCIAFEPEPNNFGFLRRNVLANNVEGRIALHNCALFSEEADLDFELSTWNLGDHRIRKGDAALQRGNEFGENKRQTIRVKAFKLDDVLDGAELRKPIACKIDTQGAEVQVLKGARNFIRMADFLILEYWPYGLARLGDSVESFLEEISCFSYGAVISLDSRQGISPELQAIETLSQTLRDIGSNQSGANYTDVLLARVPTLNSMHS
jgi:FkbM family methyltransferase